MIREIWFAVSSNNVKSYVFINGPDDSVYDGKLSKYIDMLPRYTHDRIDFDTNENMEIKTIGSLSLESTRKFCKKQYGSKVFQRIS